MLRRLPRDCLGSRRRDLARPQANPGLDRANNALHLPPIRRGRVLALVEAPVLGNQLRIPVCQELEERLARDFAQVQRHRGQRRRPVIPGRGHNLGQRPHIVGDAGEDGREHDHGGDSRSRQRAQGLQPFHRRRRARLDLTGYLLVHRRNAEAHAHPGSPGQVPQHVEVTNDHRRSGDQSHRGARVPQGFEDPPGDLVGPLGRLVGVGRGPDFHLLMRPRWMRQFAPQDLRRVDLHEDAIPPVVDPILVEEPMRATRVAESALVLASPVRIDGPLERHPPDPVEDGFHLYLDPLDPGIDADPGGLEEPWLESLPGRHTRKCSTEHLFASSRVGYLRDNV